MFFDDVLIQKICDIYQYWQDCGVIDFQFWFDMMVDDVVFLLFGSGELLFEFFEDCDGKEVVKGYFVQLMKDWEFFEWMICEFVYQGDIFVVFSDVKWCLCYNGNFVEMLKVDVMYFCDGQLIWYQEFFDIVVVYVVVVD